MKEHRFRVAIASPSASSVVETSSVVASSPAKSEEIRDHSSLRGSTSSIAREPSSMSHDSLVTELSEVLNPCMAYLTILGPCKDSNVAGKEPRIVPAS